MRHLLLGTDRLGDQGAATLTARTLATEVTTLYMGCNNITTTGACRIADHLRASPQTVQALWLKRNPLGDAAAEVVRSAAAARASLSDPLPVARRSLPISASGAASRDRRVNCVPAGAGSDRRGPNNKPLRTSSATPAGSRPSRQSSRFSSRSSCRSSQTRTARGASRTTRTTDSGCPRVGPARPYGAIPSRSQTRPAVPGGASPNRYRTPCAVDSCTIPSTIRPLSAAAWRTG
ncbi:hypothetical protein ACFQ0T_33475 [Kitasatospora gansuensis]